MENTNATTINAAVAPKKVIKKIRIVSAEQMERTRAKIAKLDAAAAAAPAAAETPKLSAELTAELIAQATFVRERIDKTVKRQGLQYRYLIDIKDLYVCVKRTEGTGSGKVMTALYPNPDKSIIISTMKEGKTYFTTKQVKLWGIEFRQPNDYYRNRHFDIFKMKQAKEPMEDGKIYTYGERDTAKQYLGELKRYMVDCCGCPYSKAADMRYNERVKWILHTDYELETSEVWKKLVDKFETKTRVAAAKAEKTEVRTEARKTVTKSNGKNAPKTKENEAKKAAYVEDIIAKKMAELEAEEAPKKKENKFWAGDEEEAEA